MKSKPQSCWIVRTKHDAFPSENLSLLVLVLLGIVFLAACFPVSLMGSIATGVAEAYTPEPRFTQYVLAFISWPSKPIYTFLTTASASHNDKTRKHVLSCLISTPHKTFLEFILLTTSYTRYKNYLRHFIRFRFSN